MGLFAGRNTTAEVKRLINQLDHNDQTTRMRAAGELVRLGPEGVLPLLEALARGGIKDTKLAGQVLVRIGGEAVPELQKLFSIPKTTQARILAADLLGRIEHPSALDALETAIQDADFQVRCHAARALAFQKSPRSVALLQRASKDPDPDVRVAAAAPLAHLAGQQSIPWLGDLLEDPELVVRQEAVVCLGKLGEAALPYLVDELKDSFWWYERREAAEVLLDSIRQNGQAAAPLLLDLLAFPEPLVRRFAIRILAEVKDPRALEPLEMALYDPHFDVCADAALALLQYEADGVKILLEALNSQEAIIRQQALAGLGQSKLRSVVPQVIAMLEDPEPSVIEQAILSLQNLGDPRAIPPLQEIANNRTNMTLRRLAREALDTFAPTIKSVDNKDPLRDFLKGEQ
ncbi:MAG: HEAT repeat domain-containing protein [Chloroflexota bacterium]